jgi:MinD superfamily P-loop ATPase
MCPAEAIDFPEKHCGDWYLSDTRFGTMVHAQLLPGEENSGRLVALLRQKAIEIAEQKDHALILADGPPGIGCPVISSLSGTGVAVIVTEPTPSGIHDLKRVAELCAHFSIPAGVIVNKFDLHLNKSRQIESYCDENGIRFIGTLPHDPVAVSAMVNGVAVTEFSKTGLADDLRQAWARVAELAGAQAVGAAIGR